MHATEKPGGKVLALAWSLGLLEVLLAIATAMWLLSLPALFGVYYQALNISPHPRDAQTIVAWLASSQPEESINAALVEGQLWPKEISHFADVRKLFRWFPLMAGALAVLSVAALFAAKPSMQTLLAAQARGLLFWIILACFAGGLAWWDWATFFAWVHYPFFGESSWRLPKSSYSLRLFPASFWRLLAGVVLAAPLLLLAMVAAASWLRARSASGASTGRHLKLRNCRHAITVSTRANKK
jgi:hypothetical protein